jgi:glycosyltransferase involved in cell wall biosynthesis
MKIAFLLGSLNRGGTETLVLDVFNNARSADLEIIGIYRNGGALYDDFINTNVQLDLLKPRFFLDPFYIIRLRRLLKKNEVNIVHAQQSFDAFYAWIAGLGTGIRVVLTFHGNNYLFGGRVNTFTKMIINKTSLNIYVSRSQMNDYKKNYNIKVGKNQTVVYNGISFDKFDNIDLQSIRKELNIPDKTILIGSVGNFVEGRDQLTVCKFLNLLNQKGAEFVFLFVGGKNNAVPWLYDDCVKYCDDHHIRDKVIFLGSRQDVPNILSQLDAFVYSTKHDTFGIAVIEAMAAGIPVFVNDWEVMTEITDQGKHGIVYKTKDEKDLLRHFMDFLNNRTVYQNKAKEDALWVRDQYSIETHMNALKQKYQSIIKPN